MINNETVADLVRRMRDAERQIGLLLDQAIDDAVKIEALELRCQLLGARISRFEPLEGKP